MWNEYFDERKRIFTPYGGGRVDMENTFLEDQSERFLYTFVHVAEWLRRWTANPMHFMRAGSSPVMHEKIDFFL